MRPTTSFRRHTRYGSCFTAMVLLFVFLFSSCGSSKTAVKNTDKEQLKRIEATHDLDKDQRKLLEEAYSWLGTPYTYAMQHKGVGTDCSGMVMSVYRDAAGCLLPRNSAKQAEFCIKINEKDAEIGDLVFFATGKDPEKVSHVGILVDEENFIHASSSKGVVVSKLHTPYYTSRLKMFGRVPRTRANLD